MLVRRSIFPIVLLMAVLTTSAFAQTGVIQGVVLDPGGAAIPNAKVTAIDESKGITARETISAQDGSFQLRPLLRGTYTVKAEIKGFKMFSREGLVLDPNQ